MQFSVKITLFSSTGRRGNSTTLRCASAPEAAAVAAHINGKDSYAINDFSIQAEPQVTIYGKITVPLDRDTLEGTVNDLKRVLDSL